MRYCLLDDADRPHAPAIAVVADLGWHLNVWLCQEDLDRWRALGISVETLSGGTITEVSRPAEPTPGYMPGSDEGGTSAGL
jgi:hypothetical protein